MTNKKKPVSIKLNVGENGIYERETWYGWGPFKAKVNDDETLTIQVPDTDAQICTPETNEYGTYYKVNFCGGTAFASVIDHEKFGNYLRLRLGDKCVLPTEVVEKMTYNPKAGAKKGKGGKAAAPKQAANLWN